MNKISLGTSDFKKLRDNNFYFIDKTLIIKEFLEDSGEIILLPRPRRFSKTFNLSILRYFLEKSHEDRSYLFKGTKIEKCPGIMENQGKYPLIYFTFKDEKHDNFNKFIESMSDKISSLYKNFHYIYDSLEFDDSKIYFDNILNRRASIAI